MKLMSRMMRWNGSTRKFLAAAALMVGLCGQAWARFVPPAPCRNAYTQEQEIEEGQKLALKVYQQMPVMPESDPVSRYVSSLGMRLAAAAPGGITAWPYSFHVVASSDINAFALPGGAMFVNLGTVQASQNEAQLAGVMAHELSHVIMRHATCNLARQQNKSIAYGIGAIASEILLGNGAAGQAAVGLINGVEGLQFLKMSREDEQQADLMGTDMLFDAGYDPRGLAQFFEIIEARSGAGGVQMLSDHPNPGDRTQYVTAEIQSLPPRRNVIANTPEFARAHGFAEGQRGYSAEEVKSGGWRSGAYASAPGQQQQYPTGQYPNGTQYPNGAQYPNGQNPNGQYPNGQYPNGSQGSQYPNNGQYPNGSQGSQYPNNGQYPANGQSPNGSQYPNGSQSSQYPNGQYPNGQYPAPAPAPAPEQPRYGNRAPQPGNGAIALRGRSLGINGRMSTYTGDGYTMSAPARWIVTPDANGAVTFAPAGGAGSFGIVYGAMVSVVNVEGYGVNDAAALQSSTTQLAERLMRENGGMRQLGQMQTLTINGQGALAVEMTGRSPLVENGRQLAEHDWLVTIARPDGDMNYIVFVAPERDFRTLRPTFQAMMNSFTAPDNQ